MITGGIDVGMEYTKTVIVKDGCVIGKAKGISGGWKRAQNVRNVWNRMLKQAGVQEDAVARVTITGKGKYNTDFNGQKVTELAALKKAAEQVCPEATMLLHAGADEILVLTFSKKAKTGISEYTLNQKCSAGIGLFLEELEEKLNVDFCKVDPAQADPSVRLNDACVTFADMDILEMLNRGVSKTDIAAAAIRFSAVRIAGVLNDITLPDRKRILLSGGVFCNPVLVSCLEEFTGESLEVLPDPEYLAAFGAAGCCL